jgi:hypothetical protein
MRIIRRSTIALLALSAVGCGLWFFVSHNPSSAFADAIADADCIVIHANGFDEQPREDRNVFLEIVDPKSIAEFNSNIRFKRSLSGGQCACQGFPGIDWYLNGERIVYTGLQHKERVRWSRCSYDMPLTDASAAWLETYLTIRNVPLIGIAEPADDEEEYLGTIDEEEYSRAMRTSAVNTKPSIAVEP